MTKKEQIKHPSIYDVVKHSGVSIVTVSRVFNDYPHVSRKMREHVFEAAREIGYRPRVVSKRHVIAVILGHLDHLVAGDYKSRLISHIIQAAAREDFLVEFIPQDAMDLATQHHVDGVIEIGLKGSELPALKTLPRVPIILTNAESSRKGWTAVCSDHALEGRLATEHLLSMGHRKIALLLDELDGWGPEQRCAGYAKALQKRGAKDFKGLVLSADDHTPLHAARLIIESGCTAGILLSDNAGMAVFDAMVNELGIQIPKDFSIVGLENENLSRFIKPRLTTIEQPLAQIARQSVAYIVNKLNRRPALEPSLLESKLIQRESVRDLR
ncbi:MAG: LacI family DNA-binding transcriptional regulator [Lentisphaerota bacterium]